VGGFTLDISIDISTTDLRPRRDIDGALCGRWWQPLDGMASLYNKVHPLALPRKVWVHLTAEACEEFIFDLSVPSSRMSDLPARHCVSCHSCLSLSGLAFETKSIDIARVVASICMQGAVLRELARNLPF
jgi:hypothetical protein